MTNGEPNFDNGEILDPDLQHIKEAIDPLIMQAPEEELSPNLYVTLPDGTHEFIPKKDIHGRFDDPSVEYIDEDGNTIKEHLGNNSGKFEAIGQAPHIEKNKHVRDYDPRQTEFDLGQ